MTGKFIGVVGGIVGMMLLINSGDAGEDSRCTANGTAYKICVSSILPGQGRYTYGPDNFGTPGQAWCEGVKGHGLGQSITIKFPDLDVLKAIEIENGYNRTAKTWQTNSRVKTLEITSSHGPIGTVTLKDTDRQQTIPVPHGRYAWVKLTIQAVFPGSKYQDTCVNSVWPDINFL